MANCPHTSFRKGQKIMVIFKDGNKLVDKFLENKSGYLILANSGKIRLKLVRSTSIFKPN